MCIYYIYTLSLLPLVWSCDLYLNKWDFIKLYPSKLDKIIKKEKLIQTCTYLFYMYLKYFFLKWALYMCLTLEYSNMRYSCM